MRISDWSSDVCSSDLDLFFDHFHKKRERATATTRGTSRHTPSVTSEMALVHTLKWVFAWFLERPALIGQSAESLARLEISHQGLGRFRESLLDAAMRNPQIGRAHV